MRTSQKTSQKIPQQQQQKLYHLSYQVHPESTIMERYNQISNSKEFRARRHQQQRWYCRRDDRNAIAGRVFVAALFITALIVLTLVNIEYNANFWNTNTRNIIMISTNLTKTRLKSRSYSNNNDDNRFKQQQQHPTVTSLHGHNTTDFSNGTAAVPAGIVWLVSFPNSGTTYTLSVVQSMTNTTTATNYGGNERNDTNDSIPIYSNVPEGPYYRNPNQLPYTTTNAHILTKTHCEQHIDGTMEHFITSCATGTKYSHGESIPTTYPIHPMPTTMMMTGVIHLIRNPFNNIVARMNYQRTQWERSKHADNQKRASFFPANRTGLQWWCYYKNEKKSIAHDRLVPGPDNGTFYETYLQPVPCWMEFYLYFRWHNMVVEMLSTKNSIYGNDSYETDSQQQPIPSMILYYEDYENHIQSRENIDQLLSFLQFTPEQGRIGPLPEFISNRTYIDFFTAEQIAAVRQLAYVMTSNTSTWSLLQHYF
jgi:hypothetical protein